MGKMNWGRILLGGIAAGVVWTVLSSIITASIGHDFMAAVPSGKLSAPSAGFFSFLFVVNIVMGIWAIWLYAAIRPRYGPGPKTALLAGISWWVISTLVDATWGSFGFVAPRAVFGPSVASLPALVVATFLGAWLYRE